MAARARSLRRIALLISAAFAVHQLRFVIAYGGDASRVLHEPGHEYLPFAAAAAGVLLLLGGVQFAFSLARCAHGAVAPGRTPAGVRVTWGQSAATLIAIYVAQESLEGAFTPGHPVWAHGGWIVVPLAITFGLVVALVLAGAHRALEEVARRAATMHERRAPEPRAARPRAAARPPLDALARHLGSRAPPGWA